MFPAATATRTRVRVQRPSMPNVYNPLVKLLNPALNHLTPRHLAVYWHYQVVRTLVDSEPRCAS